MMMMMMMMTTTTMLVLIYDDKAIKANMNSDTLLQTAAIFFLSNL